MNEHDATEQAYNNGYAKGRRYGACGFAGYLLAYAGEDGKISVDEINGFCRDYIALLERSERQEGNR